MGGHTALIVCADAQRQQSVVQAGLRRHDDRRIGHAADARLAVVAEETADPRGDSENVPWVAGVLGQQTLDAKDGPIQQSGITAHIQKLQHRTAR